MKIILFGGMGMAGHMIVDYLTFKGYDIQYTARNDVEDPRCTMMDISDYYQVKTWLQQMKPDIVINATGLLNQDAANRLSEAIYVNSLFPHLLGGLGDALGFRLIHISTDCVFEGNTGGYDESSPADGISVYAKSKSLGEVTASPHLTIRTSIIGPELKPNGIGLFHFFMTRQGDVQGYRNVYWNGVTTLALAEAIESALDSAVSGLVHLAVQPKIAKHDLLVKFRDIFQRHDIAVHPVDTKPSDKSLSSTRDDFPYAVADYDTMLRQLKSWMEASHRYYPYRFN